MRRTALPRRAVLAGLTALPALARGAGAAPGPWRRSEAAAGDLPQLRCLAIAQSGRIRSVRAFRGPGPERPANIKSVSKALVSALAGIAIDRGHLRGIGQPVLPFLRDYLPPDPDPRLRELTLADLLTMRSGLRDLSGEDYAEWATSDDWLRKALAQPLVAVPGTRMLYSTATYHVLGHVLARITGRDLHALATDWLARPLGIELPEWQRDPQGNFLGGNDMRMSPLAMLRFGEMFRRGGRWHDRVVPEAWVRASWTPRTTSAETGHDYGYGWYGWSPGGTRVHYARGYGGQLIAVVPTLELVVAITSDPRRPAPLDGHLGALFTLLEEVILPEAAEQG